MIRRLAIAACIPTIALVTALSAAVPASAGAGAGCSGSTCSVDISQFITLKGDVGSGAGYVPVNVEPPPCLWNPIGDATTGSQYIVNFFNGVNPGPSGPYDTGASFTQAQDLLKNPKPGTWYELPVNPAASQAAQQECLKLPLFYWVVPGQTPPMPPIPGRILAEFAYNNMAIPTPNLVVNPASTGFVNLGTYVWQSAGTGAVSVTAALGNQAWATVTATPGSMTLSTDGPGAVSNNCGPQGSKYPVGSPPASAGAGVSPDCGVLWQGTTSGATITGTVTWHVSWTASDGTGGTLPDIQMQGQSATFPVQEIQSINGG